MYATSSLTRSHFFKFEEVFLEMHFVFFVEAAFSTKVAYLLLTLQDWAQFSALLRIFLSVFLRLMDTALVRTVDRRWIMSVEPI